MNNQKNLIIFIDSFPYFDLEKTKFLSSFKKKAKVVPGFGYSINVKAEIFGGYSPDDLGYFCEWQYDLKSPLRRYSWLFSFLSPLGKNYYIDRISHKLISQLIYNIRNIPFEYLKYFRIEERLPYEDNFPLPTIFSQNDFEKILDSKYPAGFKRDQLIFEDARKVIQRDNYQNLFISSTDLDHITHKYGIDSQEHTRKILELDKYIEEICSLFQNKNPKGNIFIISDHGMASVDKIVSLNLEKKFGKVGEKSYIYFIEASILKVWIFKESLRKEIEDYLKNFDCGKIINFEERQRFGIASPKFGDIIFLLNEGGIFVPSFYARKKALKALHGYHPVLESQKGIFLTNKIDLLNKKNQLHAKDIFIILEHVIS